MVDETTRSRLRAPFGRDVIERILPHREPFLLIDLVEVLEPDQRIVCSRRIAADDYYLRRLPGHPPTYPATLLAEVVAQAGALLVLLRDELRGRPIYFMAIDSFEAARDLRAGETVVVEAEPIRVRRRFGSLRGVARVGSEQVASGVMRFAMDVPDGGAEDAGRAESPS